MRGLDTRGRTAPSPATKRLSQVATWDSKGSAQVATGLDIQACTQTLWISEPQACQLHLEM